LTGNTVDKGLALSTPSSAGTFDAANEIASFGGTTYTSDADGNRLTETSAAGTVSYTWDARGRLHAILAPGGVTTTFLYDYAGNMIEKRVTSTGEDNLQDYILDDVSNIVSVQQGPAVSSILDGRGPDDIMAIVQAGSPIFPLLDQISSESAFTDGSGNLIGREFYEPFGASATSGTVSLFGFTGQLQINTGLYYYRARFYDGNTGRFLSEDPIGPIGGDANFYRYAGNGPIAATDPFGTASWGGFFGSSLGAGAASGTGAAIIGNGFGYVAGAIAESWVDWQASNLAIGLWLSLPEDLSLGAVALVYAAPVVAFVAGAYAAGVVGEAVTEAICGQWNPDKIWGGGEVGALFSGALKELGGAGEILSSYFSSKTLDWWYRNGGGQ
jgi:RHS repeat-associated protein